MVDPTFRSIFVGTIRKEESVTDGGCCPSDNFVVTTKS